MNLNPQLPSVNVPSPRFTPVQAAKGTYVAKGAEVAGDIYDALVGVGKIVKGVGEMMDSDAKQAAADINVQLRQKMVGYLDGNGGMTAENYEKWQTEKQNIINKVRSNAGHFTESQFNKHFGPVNAAFDYNAWKARRANELETIDKANAANVVTTADTFSTIAQGGGRGSAFGIVYNQGLDNYSAAIEEQNNPLHSSLDQNGQQVMLMTKQAGITKVAGSEIMGLIKKGSIEDARAQLDLLEQRAKDGRPSMLSSDIARLRNACDVADSSREAVVYSSGYMANLDKAHPDTLGRYVTEDWDIDMMKEVQRLSQDMSDEGQTRYRTFARQYEQEKKIRQAQEAKDITEILEEISKQPGNYAAILAAMPDSPVKEKVMLLASKTQRPSYLADLDGSSSSSSTAKLKEARAQAGYWNNQYALKLFLLDSVVNGTPVKIGDTQTNLTMGNAQERQKTYDALNLDPKTREQLEEQIRGAGAYAVLSDHVNNLLAEEMGDDYYTTNIGSAASALTATLAKAAKALPLKNAANPTAEDKALLRDAANRVLLPEVYTPWLKFNKNLLQLVIEYGEDHPGDSDGLDRYLRSHIDDRRHMPTQRMLREVKLLIHEQEKFLIERGKNGH